MAKKGFWIDVDGQSVHVLGDPDMAQQTRQALENMARAAMRIPADQRKVLSAIHVKRARLEFAGLSQDEIDEIERVGTQKAERQIAMPNSEFLLWIFDFAYRYACEGDTAAQIMQRIESL